MAKYSGTLTIFAPSADVFAYLARFTNAQHWDPSTTSVTMLTPEPLGVGSRFEVAAEALGRKIPLLYEISQYEPNQRVVFDVRGSYLEGTDDITVDGSGQGTRMTYRSTLQFTGWRRVVNPLFGPVFQRVGDRALAGLRRALVTTLT
jgi:carbon monoxide dehydrogenase subunit G